MTIHSFINLPCSEKINLIYTEGVYVGKNKANGLITILYQVENFYVEIHYENYRKKINLINATDTTDILNAYLSQIDIKELISDSK